MKLILAITLSLFASCACYTYKTVKCSYGTDPRECVPKGYEIVKVNTVYDSDYDMSILVLTRTRCRK